MRVLGLSAHFHTASAALVDGGRPVAAAAEERFSRLRHDPAFPALTNAWLLGGNGLRGADLDAVVFYEQPHVKFTRVLSSTLASFPRHRRAFTSAMKRWLGDRLWTTNKLSKQLDVHPDRVRVVPHHRSHAAQAFLGSPFDDAAILTLDGVGEWDTTGLGSGRIIDGKLELEVGETLRYPDSLGLFYAAFTTYLGFRANADECSTMALAAFGEPRYAHVVRQMLTVASDGTYRFDPTWFDFVSLGENPFTERLVSALGPPRTPGRPLPFAIHADHSEGTPSEAHRRYADIAASVQLVLEEAVLGLARRALRQADSRNLCLAGGVALNCVANQRILDEVDLDALWIPPDPGDGGAALGAAQLVSVESGVPAAEVRQVGPYLGRSYENVDAAAMLDHMSPADWIPYRRPGLPPIEPYRLERLGLTGDPTALLDHVVADLLDGRTVGWFQGRFEMGPRALGNRSLLCHPARRDAAHKLSTRVKSRAAFRPYAFSITEGHAPRVFPQWAEATPHLARWMQTVAPVSPDWHDHLRAALHVDGTSRPQVVCRDENPLYHELLVRFGQATGLEALLNTSFNTRGEPIVSSPEEALLVFARTDLDTLVLGDLMLRKVWD